MNCSDESSEQGAAKVDPSKADVEEEGNTSPRSCKAKSKFLVFSSIILYHYLRIKWKYIYLNMYSKLSLIIIQYIRQTKIQIHGPTRPRSAKGRIRGINQEIETGGGGGLHAKIAIG